MIKVESKVILMYARIFLHAFPESQFSIMFRELIQVQEGPVGPTEGL